VLDDADIVKVSKTVSEWEKLNNNKPIWTRTPSEVTQEEYEEFFKALFKETKPPMAYSHFKAEGDAEFKSIVFIPKSPPKKFLEPDAKIENNVKLYVRKVFITDQLPDFLPRWLGILT
jgi:HSP90 family molecular chaperone